MTQKEKYMIELEEERGILFMAIWIWHPFSFRFLGCMHAPDFQALPSLLQTIAFFPIFSLVVIENILTASQPACYHSLVNGPRQLSSLCLTQHLGLPKCSCVQIFLEPNRAGVGTRVWGYDLQPGSEHQLPLSLAVTLVIYWTPSYMKYIKWLA